MALNLLPNNAMTFTENQHGTAVLEKLRSQRELVRCCDVILHVASKQFQAHRCVLAACSPYFDSIFKASKTVKEQLNISSQDPEVFQCLLTYMYTGTVVVDKTNVAELLRLANKLLIAKLKEHCAEYLDRYLDAANCLTVRDMATKFNLESLEKTTGGFISSNLSDIIEGEEVLELSHTQLEDFLRCPSWALDEDQTLLLVTRWVHHNPSSRERNLRSLLTWVQWCRLNPQTAIKLMQTHPLYSNSNSLLALFFLLDALNDNQLLPSDFLAPFYKLKAKFCQPSDSMVDNESFLSLAISTAIDGLQEDQLTSNRPPEPLVTNTDFPSHAAHPSQAIQEVSSDMEENQVNAAALGNHHKITDFHVSSRRGCEEPEAEQCPQYELCRVVGHSAEDMHINQPNVVFSHPSTSSTIVGTHAHISEDSIGETTSAEDISFSCDNQGHFGPPHARTMTLWHQEPQYTNEESLSSDSSHMYQRQVYEQGFTMKVSDSYNARVSASLVYSSRENTLKNMSYYVSNYNPEDDLTVSDDQSTQSFQYEENINPGLNCYPCRPPEEKENQHLILEPHHNQENYTKSYYQDDSASAQDINCNQRELYYNENSTDTQISNCPQDMTVQHQFSQCQKIKQDPRDEKQLMDIEDQGDPALQDRFPNEEQHYDHYLKSISEERFHRALSRPSEESLETIRQRDIVPQNMVSDMKHESSECSLDARSVMNEGDRGPLYKNCVEERNMFNEAEGSGDRRSLETELPEGITPDSLQPITALDADATPRQVKFKINRTVNSVTSGSLSGFLSNGSQVITPPEDLAHSNRLVVNTADLPHFDGDGLNPDDPEAIVQEEETTVMDKQGEARECQEEGTDGSDGNLAQGKESWRRTSSRIKPMEKAKGEDKPATTERACELCQATFPRIKDYYVHMRGHFPGPPHRCDTCEASFKRIYHLLDHRLTHQETKTHKCPHCPFSSHKKFNLTEHMALHSKSRKYKCKTCGDTFSRLQILKVHETKHTDERPFLCETCGWSGKTKNALIVHTKIHTGELLRCQFQDCSYTTAKKSHLKEHMQGHSKSRPFVCNTCGRNFITNSHLRRHMKLHLPEKPFKCPQCDYCSARQDRVKVHIKKKHTPKEMAKAPARKRQAKKKNSTLHANSQNTEEAHKVITSNADCSQGDIFSDLENTNVSLQPQLPSTPPPTTLSEYPPSPSYSYQAQSAAEDPLMIVPDMTSVTEGFTQLPQASPLHRNLSSTLNYDGSYHSPQYQTSPSHFASLSPSHATLSYANGHHQEESPLNFAGYMKYD
ncbi:uncharacterized protein LOC134779658 [Penaeus indicus]|uniref:uncharacterized protein LOC134779658 n=1 Tax=Penaeus indicus TaxID=29960 RepID=UPI00300DBA71